MGGGRKENGTFGSLDTVAGNCLQSTDLREGTAGTTGSTRRTEPQSSKAIPIADVTSTTLRK
jgi:hypothetical protein